MLKTRLLTAILVGSLVVIGLICLNTLGVAVMLGAFTLLAAFEWSSLAHPGLTTGLFFVVVVAVLGAASLHVPLQVVMGVGLAWWVWAAVEVFVFGGKAGPLWRHGVARWLSGVLVLVPTWRGCVALKAQDPVHPGLLLWLLAIVWTADSAAYFAGRRFGRRRLAPLVSPGKTLEGAVGGLIGAMVVGGGGGLFLGLSPATIVGGTALGGLVGVFSVVGDLLESKAKRLAHVKDSGRWLPGHGGILDRIDALTAAVPLFVWGLGWLGVR